MVFANPQCLMNDFYKSLGETVKSDLVHYFQVSGIKEDGKVPHLDLSYYEYLTQDVPPEEIDGAKKYVFLEEYVYRSLFCKDMFLKISRSIESYYQIIGLKNHKCFILI